MCGQFLWYLYTDTYCRFERKLNKYAYTHYVYTSKKGRIFIRYIHICDRAIAKTMNLFHLSNFTKFIFYFLYIESKNKVKQNVYS